MSKLKNQLLKKLKKEHVKPIPKAYFVLKNLSIWSATIAFVILGIFSTMFIFYFATHLEILSLVLEAPRMLPKVIFVGVPFFWLLFAIGFAFFAGFSMGKTKKGYKYSRFWVFFIGIFIQIFIGALLSQSSLAENFEQGLERRVRFFEGLERKKEALWKTPEHGFLGGQIKEVSSTNEWILVAFRGEEWIIELTEETFLPKHIKIEVGQKVRLQGNIVDQEERIFKANLVFPFRGRREHHKKDMRKFWEQLSPEEQEKLRSHREEMKEKMKKIMENLSPEEKRIFREIQRENRENKPPRFLEKRDRRSSPRTPRD